MLEVVKPSEYRINPPCNYFGTCGGCKIQNYVYEKQLDFKTEAVRNAFKRCADFLNREPDDEPTWEKIRKLLEESLLVGQKLESGLDYFNEAEARYARMEENKLKGEIFTSSFGAIDNKLNSGGPTRGEMYAWVGSPGTGKSLLLVGGAIANLNRGKKVLYISLEMSEDKVAERFDTQITNPIGILDINFRNLHQNKKDVLEALSNYVSDAVDKSLLVIKQFPGGEMGVPEYKAYLAQLKTAKGFVPDLVIIDYIGEMKDYPGKPIHQSRYEIVRDLRGHAVSEQYLIFTALQPNKFAREVQELTEIDDDNVGDSYAQSKPLDGSWSINQNRDEKEARIARVFVMKARDGESRYRFYVEYKEKTNRICEISFEEYNSRYIAQKHKRDVREKENTALELATSKAKKKKGNSANEEFAEKLGISIDDIPKK